MDRPPENLTQTKENPESPSFPLEKIIDALLEKGFSEDEILGFSNLVDEGLKSKIKKRAVFQMSKNYRKNTEEREAENLLNSQKKAKLDPFGKTLEQKTLDEFEALKNILMEKEKKRLNLFFS